VSLAVAATGRPVVADIGSDGLVEVLAVGGEAYSARSGRADAVASCGPGRRGRQCAGRPRRHLSHILIRAAHSSQPV